MSNEADRMIAAIGDTGMEEEAGMAEEGMGEEAVMAQLSQLSPDQVMSFAAQAASMIGPEETSGIISGIVGGESTSMLETEGI